MYVDHFICICILYIIMYIYMCTTVYLTILSDVGRQSMLSTTVLGIITTTIYMLYMLYICYIYAIYML